MLVWLDLANAPHVAFFVPIVRELLARGHQVVVTARDFNQTVELAALNGLAATGQSREPHVEVSTTRGVRGAAASRRGGQSQFLYAHHCRPPCGSPSRDHHGL
jgi:uncharacterized protein YbjT (DUF2867 family)